MNMMNPMGPTQMPGMAMGGMQGFSMMQGGMGMDPSMMMQGGMGMGMDPSMMQGGFGLGAGNDRFTAQIQSMMSGMMAILTATVLMQMVQLAQSIGQGGGAVSGGNPGFGGGSGGGAPGAQNFLGGQASPSGGAGQTKGGEEVGSASGKLVQRPGGKIDSSIAKNFDNMVAAANKDGVKLEINSGFRSHHEQEVLYQKYLNGTGNLAAKPGSSNHEKGQAVDFKNNKGAHAWLAKNATRFGFKNLPGEPWHYSPTGR